MSKRNILIHSAVALALAGSVFTSLSAEAALGAAGNNVNYATENFPGQDSIVVPAASASLTANAGEIANSSTITFRLSSGTFTSAPTVTVVGGNGPTLTSTTATLNSDKTTATVTVTAAGVNTGAGSVQLNSLSLAGVSSTLTNAASAISVTVLYNNAAQGAVQPIATSLRAYAFANAAGNNGVIDVANGGAGQKFRNGSLNQTFWTLGTTSIGAASNAVLIDGVTALVASTNDTLGATLTGNTAAFSSVYLSTSSCTATAPSGSIAGTLTATGATFINLLAASTVYNICVVANGTNIIPAVKVPPYTIAPAVTFAPRTLPGGLPISTPYTPAPSTVTANVAQTDYNGSVASFNYMVGITSGYTGLIRAANAAQTDATVYAVVRREDGTLFNNLTLATSQGVAMPLLKAGTQAFYTAADLQAANGGTAVLTPAFPRATITLLSTNTQTGFTNLLSNPGGVVNNLQ